MADENRKSDKRISGDDKGQAGAVGQNKKDTGTGTAEKGRAGAGTADNRTAAGTAGAEKEVVSRLVTVKDDIPKPSEPKKASKKRTRTTKTKKNDVAFNAEQITALLMTTSVIMSQSEVGKIFSLTQKECEQIATPLANIIATNDSLKALSEHSDAVALVTACFMIFVPKIFVFFQYTKQKKALKENNVKIFKKEVSQNGSNETGTHGNGDSGDSRPATNDVYNVNKDLNAAIPSLA